MEEELSKAHSSLSKEAEKYHQLKKEYAELHENLTSILKENIELQEVKARQERETMEL